MALPGRLCTYSVLSRLLQKVVCSQAGTFDWQGQERDKSMLVKTIFWCPS